MSGMGLYAVREAFTGLYVRAVEAEGAPGGWRGEGLTDDVSAAHIVSADAGEAWKGIGCELVPVMLQVG